MKKICLLLYAAVTAPGLLWAQRIVKEDTARAPLELRTVIVTASGGAGASVLHTLSQIDLNMHPARSSQDLLRLVPGLFIAQHQGGGKAEQIFLRGFDADHGTDVHVSVDGVPVNLVSQAHGQGYADLHFLIPELVSGYEFGKGPYYAGYGDFTTAGYVAYHTVNIPDKSMVKLEGGQFNMGRVVALIDLLGKKARLRGQSAYVAGEALYFDGPFDYPEHFQRSNLFGKFILPLGAKSKLTLGLSTLHSGWRASGEIPDRALAEGIIPDRFGVIDSAQGGYTTRTNVYLKLQTKLSDGSSIENQVYYSHYYFDLISNFTFYYFYPQTGDEFRQHESRNMAGYTTRLSHQADLAGGSLHSTLGAGLRYDAIDPSYLAHSSHRQTILDYIQLGRIKQSNGNAWLDERFETGKWSFDMGLRMDYLHFYYKNLAPAGDSSASIYFGLDPRSGKAIVSPKFNIQYTPGTSLQYYIKAGKGFHSNDARIVIAHDGHDILPAAYGADAGVNWKPAPDLFVNAAVWILYLQQEFTYGADLGDQAVSPGGRTLRKGIDLSARYRFNPWLYTWLNIDLARPRDLDAAKGQNYLTLAPTLTSTGGIDIKLSNGIDGSIGYRYMHDRAANENYSLTAQGYWISDLTISYTKNKYEVGVAIENLFNTRWNEAVFDYTSRFKNERHPVEDVSYTPGLPFFAKFKCSFFF